MKPLLEALSQKRTFLQAFKTTLSTFDVMKTGLDTQVVIFTDDCFFQFSTTEIFNDFSENVPRAVGMPLLFHGLK